MNKQSLINLLLAICAVFAPIRATIITVMVLTIIDLISGLMAAKHRKEAITSSGLKRTIVKIFIYEAAVLLGYLTEQYMTGDLIPVMKILAGYIGITELTSVLENLEEITGLSILKKLINKLSKSR